MIRNASYDDTLNLLINNAEVLKGEFIDPEIFGKSPSNLQKLRLLRFYNASTAYNFLSCNLFDENSKQSAEKFLKEEVERLCLI